MGDIVNLRRARKDRKRQDADKNASANRLAFGRPKAERSLTDARNQLDARRIDAHRRETPDDTSGSSSDASSGKPPS